MKLYAHSGKSPDKSDWQTLDDHLLNVARLASDFTEDIGASNWGYSAGLLHDVGKASQLFQARLEGSSLPFDHSTMGGRIAVDLYPESVTNEGSILAPIILGHHGGLPNNTVSSRLTSVRDRLLSAGQLVYQFPSDVPKTDNSVAINLKRCSASCGPHAPQALCVNTFLLGHLLFSSLVDADWLDTERVMDAASHEERVQALLRQASLEELNQCLDGKLSQFDACEQSPVNVARAKMLHEAQNAACSKPGIFTLTMPTGGGKTLASLSFALRHAIANEKNRIIYAIPFQSIVDQTASQFREILGRENVVEHVSSYDYGYNQCAADDSSENELARRERMLAQNWDAPLVVTTNVQLFESLFANKPSRVRKVHSIANSVIVLDEVQSLPDQLLEPTLAMIESLVLFARCSVVLCTATQPALDTVWPLGSKPKAVIHCPEAYRDVFASRVQFDTTHLGDSNAYVLDDLVNDLACQHQVLCVVSSRIAARLVYDALTERIGDDESVFHLSALMVPSHRAKVLQKVRSRLDDGLPVRVVSTQLIEAGVDIDFPVVYREMAGIDSILQAAGRCNREGKLSIPGSVVVFECSGFPKFKSKNWLSAMRALGNETVAYFSLTGVNPFGTQAVKYFFERRYQGSNLDGRDVFHRIAKGDSSDMRRHSFGQFDYEEIADAYRFIAEDTVELFVPWEADGEALLDEIVSDKCESDYFYRLQSLTISLPRYLFTKYEKEGVILVVEGFPVPILSMGTGSEKLYDDKRGLLNVGEGDMDVLVV